MKPAIFAMGGAIDLDGRVLRSFYECSGGADGRIVILPTASSLPDAGHEYREAFSRFGLREPALVLNIRKREQADQPEAIEAMQQATGIFFTGGNQMRLSAHLGGTRLHAEMQLAYQRGAVVGGTSAGAAALSSMMIAFGSSGAFPRHRIAHMAAGLGFAAGLIFDQHFRQRNRLGRLIYAVAQNPALLGIGVDENTAAVVSEDQIQVVGLHGVTIVDGCGIQESNVSEANSGDMITVNNITLHLLSEGCSFDLLSRKARLAPVPGLAGT